MCETAAEVQELVFRAAVFLVLLLSIVACSLVSPRVLPLKGKNRQSVYVEHHVYLVAWFQARVGLLSGYGELVLLKEQHILLRIGWRRFWIPKFQRNVLYFDTFTQHFDDAEGLYVLADTFGDGTLQGCSSHVGIEYVLLGGM